jgi:hypothetical protein
VALAIRYSDKRQDILRSKYITCECRILSSTYLEAIAYINAHWAGYAFEVHPRYNAILPRIRQSTRQRRRLAVSGRWSIHSAPLAQLPRARVDDVAFRSILRPLRRVTGGDGMTWIADTV